MMVVGDKWQIFVNADLAYGNTGSGRDIPPGAVLVFELELLEIKPRLPSRTETAEKNLKHRAAVAKQFAIEAAERPELAILSGALNPSHNSGAGRTSSASTLSDSEMDEL